MILLVNLSFQLTILAFCSSIFPMRHYINKVSIYSNYPQIIQNSIFFHFIFQAVSQLLDGRKYQNSNCIKLTPQRNQLKQKTANSNFCPVYGQNFLHYLTIHTVKGVAVTNKFYLKREKKWMNKLNAPKFSYHASYWKYTLFKTFTALIFFLIRKATNTSIKVENMWSHLMARNLLDYVIILLRYSLYQQKEFGGSFSTCINTFS